MESGRQSMVQGDRGRGGWDVFATGADTDPGEAASEIGACAELDVADCPLCFGTGMVLGSTGPTGDDPERPCDLCAGIGQVPEGYAHAYRELLRENDRLDATVWGLQKQAVSAKARIAELRRANNGLKTALAKLQRANAPPADTPRGRRPLPR